ncbi:MAG: hypothetical protein Kow00109_23580 [Acidobacteriota bacterium]
MLVEWRLEESGLVFEVPDLADPTARAGCEIFQGLLEKGILEQTNGRFFLPFEKVYELEPHEGEFLRLPRPTVLSVELGSQGIPGHPGFRVAAIVRHPRLGRLDGAIRRMGPFFLPFDEPPILAPRLVYLLLELVERGPASSRIEDHFAFLARVQELGKASGAVLNGLLAREDYEFPDSVQIDIGEASPERIELIPQIRGFYAHANLQEAIRRGRLPRVHFVPQGRGRRRFVFDQQLRSLLAELARRRFIEGEDVPRFLANPEAFLPEGIDLSEFSKRVKGIKVVVYNSRPYLHVTRRSGGWLEVEPRIAVEPEIGPEGLDSEDGVGGTQSETSVDFDEVREAMRDAVKKGKEFVRFGDGWVRVPRDLDRFAKIIEQGTPVGGGRLRLPERGILEIYENLELLEFADEAYLPPGWDPEQLPPLELSSWFRGRLYPHQEFGVRWLSLLERRKTGGLLADEMGLGKTVQVLAHLAKLAERGELRPSLVVCPKTLVPVWSQELSRFLSKDLEIAVIEGGGVTADALRRLDLVLCSYEVLRRNQLEMARVDWQIVVCDEAQYVKNPTAQRTTSAKALKSKHRVALTGTPVENGLVEFWCIVDFIAPGLLGSWKEFRQDFEQPIVAAQDPYEQDQRTEQLLKRLGPHYLRRAKEEVLRGLPPKEFKTLEVPLSREQVELYRAIARTAKRGGRGAVLAAIHQLFLVCGHPQALDGNVMDFRYTPGRSLKLDRTLDLLREIRERGEKAIIFTRWIRLQEIIRSAVQQVFGIPVAVINGQTQGDRTRFVERFSQAPGFNVLILSHDVAGVGLTITAANHVIHYTRPWNPAKESQATDRVHRIGQDKPVTVYYPVVVHPEFKTVEVRLAELLEDKMDLARNVLRPTSALRVKETDFVESVDEAVQSTPTENGRIASGVEESEGLRVTEDWRKTLERISGLRPGDRALEHVIPEGATGYSFKDILAPFLAQARKIELRDPRLLKAANLGLLTALVEAVSSCCPRGFQLRLVGVPPDPEEEEPIASIIETLRGGLTEQGAEIEVREDPEVLESYVRLDSGWRLVFSDGLNIFSNKAGLFPHTTEDQLRTPCRPETIWIYRE